MSADHEEFVQRQRFTHGPSWRWQLAEAAATETWHKHLEQAGQPVRELSEYLRQCRASPDQREAAVRAFPDLAAVQALSGTVSTRLKILVIGGCAPEVIARHTQLSEKVIAAWESLRFDVRPLLGRANDWILAKAILPEHRAGNERLAAQLKFAYSGGPIAAEAILVVESRVLLKCGVTLFDAKVVLHERFVQAMQAPLDSNRDCMAFIKLRGELMWREQRLKFAERRLQQKSLDALRAHDRALRRLELQRQREERRAKEAAQREAERAERRDAKRQQRLQQAAAALARILAQETRRQRAARSAWARLRWAPSEDTDVGVSA